MPLTNSQITAFFEDTNNMAVNYYMVMKLQEEEIKDVDDL